MQRTNKLEMLERLQKVDIETQVGGLIENHFELFLIEKDVVHLFERFLRAKSVENRRSALCALVVYGKLAGYEADAVLFHYQSRDDGPLKNSRR